MRRRRTPGPGPGKKPHAGPAGFSSGQLKDRALADGVGFEPTVGLAPTPVFKTGAFNRSATHPTAGAGRRMPAPCSAGSILLGYRLANKSDHERRCVP